MSVEVVVTKRPFEEECRHVHNALQTICGIEKENVCELVYDYGACYELMYVHAPTLFWDAEKKKWEQSHVSNPSFGSMWVDRKAVEQSADAFASANPQWVVRQDYHWLMGAPDTPSFRFDRVETDEMKLWREDKTTPWQWKRAVQNMFEQEKKTIQPTTPVRRLWFNDGKPLEVHVPEIYSQTYDFSDAKQWMALNTDISELQCWFGGEFGSTTTLDKTFPFSPLVVHGGSTEHVSQSARLATIIPRIFNDNQDSDCKNGDVVRAQFKHGRKRPLNDNDDDDKDEDDDRVQGIDAVKKQQQHTIDDLLSQIGSAWYARGDYGEFEHLCNAIFHSSRAPINAMNPFLQHTTPRIKCHLHPKGAVDIPVATKAVRCYWERKKVLDEWKLAQLPVVECGDSGYVVYACTACFEKHSALLGKAGPDRHSLHDDGTTTEPLGWYDQAR